MPTKLVRQSDRFRHRVFEVNLRAVLEHQAIPRDHGIVIGPSAVRDQAPQDKFLVALGLQKLFRFYGSHAPGAGGGNGLLIDAILNVAGVEHARHAGARATL